MPETNRDEIAKLEALYASNPEGRVFTHLAEAYRKGGEFDRARTILEQGLTKHPGYASAYVVLGRVFFDLNDMQQATESFRRVLDLDPHNLVALRSLGDIERSAGRNSAALGYFQELRHQDPSNAEIENIVSELRNLPDTEDRAESEPPASQQPEEVVGAEPAMPAAVSEDVELQPAVAENLPEFDTPVPDYGDLVSPGIDIDWSTGEATEEEQALPGDLANFANLVASAPAAEPVLPEPPPELTDLPTSEAEGSAWKGGLPSLEADAAEPAGEVVTETMAQLYRDQGLYDRSAEVYRALLRERPNDWALQAGLQEVEMLSTGGGTAQDAGVDEGEPIYELPVEAEPEPLPSIAAGPEATPSVEEPPQDEEPPSPWMSPASPAAEPASIYSWAEEERKEEPQEGAPIGTYFQGLLSWRPSGNGPQSSFAPAPEVEDEPAVLELDLPADTAHEPMFEEPLLAAEPEEEAPEGMPEPRQVPGPPAIPPDELMPWEEPASPSMPDAPVVPPPAAPPAAPQVPQSLSDNPVDEAFDAWFNAASPTGSREVDPMPAPLGAPPAPPLPAPDTMAPQTSGGDSEDDDDLEMFRSWLQSLKK